MVKNKKIITIITLLLVVGVFFYLVSSILKNTSSPDDNKTKITVFKSPTCGCCVEYIAYLESKGFKVETKQVQDMSPVKDKYNIPRNMESCHTAIIGDYFVEGHVSIEAIDKLLEEKPDIDGIALPGMPSGSPGMPGSKMEQFKIYALSDGTTSEFMII